MTPAVREGQRVGRWTVLGPTHPQRGSQNRSAWWCRCECGTRAPVVENNLKRGRSLSCGCVRVEKLRSRRSREKMQ